MLFFNYYAECHMLCRYASYTLNASIQTSLVNTKKMTLTENKKSQRTSYMLYVYILIPNFKYVSQGYGGSYTLAKLYVFLIFFFSRVDCPPPRPPPLKM
jgi:hypothetical protein